MRALLIVLCCVVLVGTALCEQRADLPTSPSPTTTSIAAPRSTVPTPTWTAVATPSPEAREAPLIRRTPSPSPMSPPCPSPTPIFRPEPTETPRPSPAPAPAQIPRRTDP